MSLVVLKIRVRRCSPNHENKDAGEIRRLNDQRVMNLSDPICTAVTDPVNGLCVSAVQLLDRPGFRTVRNTDVYHLHGWCRVWHVTSTAESLLSKKRRNCRGKASDGLAMMTHSIPTMVFRRKLVRRPLRSTTLPGRQVDVNLIVKDRSGTLEGQSLRNGSEPRDQFQADLPCVRTLR